MPKLASGTVEEFFDFVRERISIYNRRAAGQPWPWTDDPILQQYRFTNIHREHDRTTVFVREKIREPFRDDKGTLIANIVMARTINWPPMIANVGYIKQWDAEVRDDLESMFAKRKAAGQKMWTDAYIIRSRFGAAKYTSVFDTFELIWRDRESLYEQMHGGTLQYAFQLFLPYPYIGVFLSYEFVTDLRWTPILEGASDIMTWANAGPGAERGLRRMYPEIRPGGWLGMMRDLLAEAHHLGFEDFEMREIEQALCEFDKYLRIKHGEGPSRKYVRSEEALNAAGSDL